MIPENIQRKIQTVKHEEKVALYLKEGFNGWSETLDFVKLAAAELEAKEKEIVALRVSSTNAHATSEGMGYKYQAAQKEIERLKGLIHETWVAAGEHFVRRGPGLQQFKQIHNL